MPGDASSRRYIRLKRGDKKSILMDAPQGAETPSEPEGATILEREALGYNALARIAGNNPESFAGIANELSMRGFSAPKILASDLKTGLILLEDLGADLFARAIETDRTLEEPLYKAAIDTLAAIYRSTFSKEMRYGRDVWRVRDYDATALQTEADLFLEWFLPDAGIELSNKAKDKWYAIWAELWPKLDAHAPGLALRDFHAENLFWLPERQATSRVGLIDFQDGLFAHPAYDLVSLLEDARRDVNPLFHETMKQRFCDKAGLVYDEAFKTAYAVMGAQRNTKILGIFIRLAVRDGKENYRDLIPRVARWLEFDLREKALHPLRDWFEEHASAAFETRAPITTAMIMAAGHGTRMRPLTNDRSKAMVEVGGKPLIDHMLDRLRDVGVKKAIVNVHAHADHLEAHLRKRTDLPEIIISDERDELLETGGGVVKALPLLGNEPIFICNIDAIWLENSPVLEKLLSWWNPIDMDDLFLLAPIEDTLGHAGQGDFEKEISGRVHRREGDSAPFVYAGVQIANLDPVREFPCEKFSRNKVWDVSLKKERTFGVEMDGFWMHVGDPQARDEAEEILKTGIRPKGT